MKARSRKKPRLRRLIFFLFFIGAGLGLFYALSLPIWQIREVVVEGTQMLFSDEIKALAGIPLSENLFFTRFSRARANLSKITAIADFKIRRIPPGTVVILIRERKPSAAVVFSDKSFVIDKEGYIINRSQGLHFNIPNLIDLPVVSGVDESQIMAGEKIEEGAAKTIADIISDVELFLEPGKLHLDAGKMENINLLLDDILKVKLGVPVEIKRKMKIFSALLPQVSGRWPQVEYIDVRSPDNPAIKFK